jgi:hypothetical protein
VAKTLLEPTLVMIKALDRLIINATDIDNDVAGVKDSRVSRALEV